MRRSPRARFIFFAVLLSSFALALCACAGVPGQAPPPPATPGAGPSVAPAGAAPTQE